MVHAFPPVRRRLFTHIDSRKPLAAIVAHVFRDDLVNLTVCDSTRSARPNQRPASAGGRGQARTRLFLRMDALRGWAGREARQMTVLPRRDGDVR